jgi:N-glycosylase/DNA lyase
MNISVIQYDEGIIFKNVDDFETKHIFECGQCFRWNEDADNGYIGVVCGRAVRVFKKGDDVFIKGGKIEDSEFWKNYFDLNLNYTLIKERLSSDKILCEAVKYGYGIRILNQEPFEIVISFIISANNRISMIKRAVDKICQKFGDPIEFEGKMYYSFPEPNILAQAELSDIEGCGFRAPYIIATAGVIASGEFNLNTIMKMNLEDAHNELMKLMGVGPKVADCIALFSLKKNNAFPVDVWVKRVMQHFYLAPDESLKKIREFGMKKFGDYAGISQQYLFYYAREKRIGTEK